ncbi:WD repeat-containing protein 75 [Poecilia latipinna]|uniref:WD repeat-containing protein 75 n=1 Tax=Poecilia latipinna TaxID=48699 RepID=UPI00072DB3CA|nr:PREDICTED: WD repeat-containing protein 75 [Poecilia latipinna]
MVEQAEIRVVHQGGSNITFREPAISSDSRFLLCASGHNVKVFSTVTEECVQELRGHTDLVTGVLLRPSNHLQAYSCSADGTVRLWDFTDGILIKTYVIGYPICSIYASASHDGVIFIATPTKGYKTLDSLQLLAVHLPQTAGQLVETSDLSAVLSDVSANPATVAFGRAGEYVASTNGVQLQIFFFKKQKSFRFSLKENSCSGRRNTFTCVACHPTDDCIATGHEDGKIRLWRNFDQKREYTYRTLHWHHSTVRALCFTPEGSNLLSGGVESVLVQWRYQQESQQDFLPRLGAAITHIAVSPDGALFCTSHSDNKIVLIQSCVKVSSIIQGLVKGEAVQTDLMVDPRSKALVLNGKPGHLQFYSLQRDRLLFNLDVVQQEFIHQEGLDQFQVVMATLDGAGAWLATVEERKQETVEAELNLKLWAFDEPSQSFVLNTTVSTPHEVRITAVTFDPAARGQTSLLVSCGRDGLFKAWRLAPPAHPDDGGPSWTCDFVSGYHGLTPQRCCFSADGSLLAVGFQEVVTVWSPASWELLLTLSQPPGIIRDLCFGRLSCSKFLLGTTSSDQLCCWNLLTCSLEWSTSMEVSLLLADPLSDNMAAFCHQDGNTDLFVFKPSEPRPLFSQKAVCSGRVSRAVFAPREVALESCEESSQWLNRSQLYFLTPLMDLLTFSTRAEEERLMTASKQLVVDDSVAMTPFQLLLGKRRPHHQAAVEDPAVRPPAERPVPPGGSAAVRELLQSPAHVLPAAAALCSVFMEALLGVATETRENETSAGETPSDPEEEEEEDSDQEMETRATRPERGLLETDSADPVLSRAQVRELRRVRKLDHSWFSSLLDS